MLWILNLIEVVVLSIQLAYDADQMDAHNQCLFEGHCEHTPISEWIGDGPLWIVMWDTGKVEVDFDEPHPDEGQPSWPDAVSVSFSKMMLESEAEIANWAS